MPPVDTQQQQISNGAETPAFIVSPKAVEQLGDAKTQVLAEQRQAEKAAAGDLVTAEFALEERLRDIGQQLGLDTEAVKAIQREAQNPEVNPQIAQELSERANKKAGGFVAKEAYRNALTQTFGEQNLSGLRQAFKEKLGLEKMPPNKNLIELVLSDDHKDMFGEIDIDAMRSTLRSNVSMNLAESAQKYEDNKYVATSVENLKKWIGIETKAVSAQVAESVESPVADGTSAHVAAVEAPSHTEGPPAIPQVEQTSAEVTLDHDASGDIKKRFTEMKQTFGKDFPQVGNALSLLAEVDPDIIDHINYRLRAQRLAENAKKASEAAQKVAWWKVFDKMNKTREAEQIDLAAEVEEHYQRERYGYPKSMKESHTGMLDRSGALISQLYELSKIPQVSEYIDLCSQLVGEQSMAKRRQLQQRISEKKQAVEQIYTLYTQSQIPEQQRVTPVPASQPEKPTQTISGLELPDAA